MCVCRCLAVAVMLSPSFVLAETETTDVGRSAAALKALAAEIQAAKSTPIGGLASKDFATVPLPRPTPPVPAR